MGSSSKASGGGGGGGRRGGGGSDYNPMGTVEFLRLDLADLVSVRSFASAFLGMGCPLHYLICNAAEMVTPAHSPPTLPNSCMQLRQPVNAG